MSWRSLAEGELFNMLVLAQPSDDIESTELIAELATDTAKYRDFGPDTFSVRRVWIALGVLARRGLMVPYLDDGRALVPVDVIDLPEDFATNYWWQPSPEGWLLLDELGPWEGGP